MDNAEAVVGEEDSCQSNPHRVLTVKRAALFLVMAGCIVLQLAGGVRQTLWSGFPKLPNPSLRALQIPLSLQDFLLLYSMFSPSVESEEKSRETVERLYRGGFSIQRKIEVWAELEDGRVVRLSGRDYLPDPRDEVVILGSKRLQLGGRFPLSLLNKGESPTSVFGKEMMVRYNLINPGKKAAAIYIRRVLWPAGTLAKNQNYGGVEKYSHSSVGELCGDSAWGRAKLTKIWPEGKQ